MPKPKIQITEPITRQDFDDAIRLVGENLFKSTGLRGEFEGLAVGEMILAKVDGRVVGLLTSRMPGRIFKEYGDEFIRTAVSKEKVGYISIVSVDKEYQGRGIGKKLVERALSDQKEWGAEVVAVHTSKNSPGGASEKLFSSFGFEPGRTIERPWYEYTKKRGQQNFCCVFCGNPCVCDELEMVKYL